MDKFKVILAPGREQAESLPRPEATVEAEYGDFCIEGSVVTLAHHGVRSCNPAPCNTKNVPVLDSGTILVSHVDLDALGGILAVMGAKMEDPDFWEGAERIDVQGLHHIHELSQEVQDKLNAFYAVKDQQPYGRYTEITDVSDLIEVYRKALIPILDSSHSEHDAMIEAGRQWEAAATAKVEGKLLRENECIRCFSTDGVFCAAGYYSPNQKKIIPATVTMNTVHRSVTVAFADGGKALSAKAIVQELWGPDAGGRDGIAGSPRSWSIEEEQLENEFERACDLTEKYIKEVWGTSK